MRELTLVLTRLGWCEIFAGRPRWHDTKGWILSGYVFPLDPLRVKRLKLRRLLRVGVPRSFSITASSKLTRWSLMRANEQSDLVMLVGRRVGLEMCWRLTKLLGLMEAPIGELFAFVPGEELTNG